jgi:hypothetical protein
MEHLRKSDRRADRKRATVNAVAVPEKVRSPRTGWPWPDLVLPSWGVVITENAASGCSEVLTSANARHRATKRRPDRDVVRDRGPQPVHGPARTDTGLGLGPWLPPAVAARDAVVTAAVLARRRLPGDPANGGVVRVAHTKAAN